MRYVVTFQQAGSEGISVVVEALSVEEAGRVAIKERWPMGTIHEPDADGWRLAEYITYDGGYHYYNTTDFRLIVEDSLGYAGFV